MKLSYQTRKRLALLVLVVGLPAYIVAVATLVPMLALTSKWLELIVYVLAGIVWAFPLKPLFVGIGRSDPDA